MLPSGYLLHSHGQSLSEIWRFLHDFNGKTPSISIRAMASTAMLNSQRVILVYSGTIFQRFTTQ